MEAVPDDELHRERLSGRRVDALEVLDHPTRFDQQRVGLEQRIAVASERFVLRQRHGTREHPLRHLVAQRFQNLEFGRRRQPLGLHSRTHEVAVVAFQAAVPVDAVRPIEVVGQRQRLPDPYVLEQGAAVVEYDALVHAVGIAHAVGFPFEEPLVIGVEIVGRVEMAFVLLEKQVHEARPERLEHDIPVKVIREHYAVEIVVPVVDVEVFPPIVLHAFKDQLVSGLHLGQPIGPVAERWLEGCGGEVSVFPVMSGQRRETGGENDQMRTRLRLIGEMEPERPRTGLLYPVEVAVIDSPTDGRLGLQHFEGPQNVVDSHRFAVVPVGVVAQRIGDPTVVVGHLHAFREQAVIGSQFVFGPPHEVVVNP